MKSNAKGGEPAEVAERHPRLNPCEKLNVILNSERSERDSGSVPRCELPLTLARFRNSLARLAKNGTAKSVVFALCLRSLAQFGMTLKEMTRVCAFTMAEILLSLTIIGVVAAITLPSLTGNINERTWNTQRKALYARMSQAIALMPSLNGYGVLKEETDSAGSTSIVDTAAETFITGGLAKVLKINNICDYEHLEDCGIPEKYNDLLGSKHSFPKYIGDLNSDFIVPSSFWGGSYYLLNTRLAAFETANGESVAVFYNPYCNYANEENTGSYYYSQQTICANLIYDLNGQKGPNTFGKDIGFITFIYPTNTLTVMPMPYAPIAGYTTAKLGTSLCREKFGEDAKLLDRFEYAALFVNKNLTGLNFNNGTFQLTSSRYVSSTGRTRYWHFNFAEGIYRADDNDAAGGIYCVKRNQ